MKHDAPSAFLMKFDRRIKAQNIDDKSTFVKGMIGISGNGVI
jgi:hypothetical protein